MEIFWWRKTTTWVAEISDCLFTRKYCKLVCRFRYSIGKRRGNQWCFWAWRLSGWAKEDDAMVYAYYSLCWSLVKRIGYGWLARTISWNAKKLDRKIGRCLCEIPVTAIRYGHRSFHNACRYYIWCFICCFGTRTWIGRRIDNSWTASWSWCLYREDGKEIWIGSYGRYKNSFRSFYRFLRQASDFRTKCTNLDCGLCPCRIRYRCRYGCS